jgi:hypothetical protein
MSYFERRLPIALILGSFFVVFAPLALLQVAPNFFEWLPYLVVLQAVGLGTSHFFVTFALYLQSVNLDYFASTWRNRIVYFVAPALFLLFFAWTEAAQLRAHHPLVAAYLFGAVRFFDFFHVGRQSVGMLQLFKRSGPAGLPAWSRKAENAFFVGMALLQWQTYLLDGFAGDKLYAVGPAVGVGVLFVVLASVHLQHAARSGSSRSFLPFAYFAMQAVCAAAAVYQTRLYLIALTLHYVEYHVIMAPRCLRTPLHPERAVDRVSGLLRKHALLFYGALAAVVVLFELRNHVPSGLAPTTTFFVHIFDGVFLAHYFVEAFLWKFGNPYYRAALSPLYFGTSPPPGDAGSRPVPAPAPVPRPRWRRAWPVAAAAGLLLLALGQGSAGALAAALRERLIDPLHAQNHMRWGAELLREGEVAEARRHFEEVLRRDAGNRQARMAVQWIDQQFMGGADRWREP